MMNMAQRLLICSLGFCLICAAVYVYHGHLLIGFLFCLGSVLSAELLQKTNY